MKTKLSIIIGIIFLTSCMHDDLLWKNRTPVIQKETRGVFIINEGNFMYDNASLSYYNIKNKKIYNNIFFETNNVSLGDVAQSMIVRDSLGYIVINNSGKVYVIDINTFEIKGKITGLISPRYMFFDNENKAYITDLYAKSISIVNPKTRKIIGSIDVNNNSEFGQHPTEQMVKNGDFIYINCWSYDNKILVLNSKTDQIVDSIEVSIQPSCMVLDKNNKLWVITDGGFKGSPYGYEQPTITRINLNNNKIDKVIKFDKKDVLRSLRINGNRDSLFFINKHVYTLGIDDNSTPYKLIESQSTAGGFGGFYSIAIDPVNSDLYIADAIDFMQNGVVYRYNSNITPVDTFKVGIIPGNFCFIY